MLNKPLPLICLATAILIASLPAPAAFAQHGGGAPRCRGCAGSGGAPDSSSDANTYVAIYAIVDSGSCTDQGPLTCHQEACTADVTIDWQVSALPFTGQYCDGSTPPNCLDVTIDEGASQGQAIFSNENVQCGDTDARSWSVNGLTVSTTLKCSKCKKQPPD